MPSWHPGPQYTWVNEPPNDLDPPLFPLTEATEITKQRENTSIASFWIHTEFVSTVIVECHFIWVNLLGTYSTRGKKTLKKIFNEMNKTPNSRYDSSIGKINLSMVYKIKLFACLGTVTIRSMREMSWVMEIAYVLFVVVVVTYIFILQSSSNCILKSIKLTDSNYNSIKCSGSYRLGLALLMIAR